MRAGNRRIQAVASGIAIGTALVLMATEPASAQGTNVTSASCGYDGYQNNRPLYTHCGKGRVEIKVDHFFWQKTYFCAVPGAQEIPQGTSQWRIIGAEYDGKSC
jgi:hypothetical protein